MALYGVSSQHARKNLRRKTVLSSEIDVGAAANLPDNVVLASFPPTSRVVISEIRLVWTEDWAGTSGSIDIGHIPASGTADPNSLVSARAFVAGDNALVVSTLTLASTLTGHKAWPGTALLPAGSQVLLDTTSSSPTAGKFHVAIDYWEFDDEYD